MTWIHRTESVRRVCQWIGVCWLEWWEADSIDWGDPHPTFEELCSHFVNQGWEVTARPTSDDLNRELESRPEDGTVVMAHSLRLRRRLMTAKDLATESIYR